MQQPDLFDLEEGRRLRQGALDAQEDQNPTWLEEARRVAQVISDTHGQVNANEVRRVMEARALFPKHPNAWGSVFRGKSWQRTGERVPSAIKTSHASEISVWRHVH